MRYAHILVLALVATTLTGAWWDTSYPYRASVNTSDVPQRVQLTTNTSRAVAVMNDTVVPSTSDEDVLWVANTTHVYFGGPPINTTDIFPNITLHAGDQHGYIGSGFNTTRNVTLPSIGTLMLWMDNTSSVHAPPISITNTNNLSIRLYERTVRLPRSNNWTHIAVTWQSNATMRVYRDGILAATHPLYPFNTTPTTLDAHGDELRLYDDVKTTAWIARSYEAQRAPTPLTTDVRIPDITIDVGYPVRFLAPNESFTITTDDPYTSPNLTITGPVNISRVLHANTSGFTTSLDGFNATGWYDIRVNNETIESFHVGATVGNTTTGSYRLAPNASYLWLDDNLTFGLDPRTMELTGYNGTAAFKTNVTATYDNGSYTLTPGNGSAITGLIDETFLQRLDISPQLTTAFANGTFNTTESWTTDQTLKSAPSTSREDAAEALETTREIADELNTSEARALVEATENDFRKGAYDDVEDKRRQLNALKTATLRPDMPRVSDDELTWLLGVIIATTLLFGIAYVYRHRRDLQDEIASLEERRDELRDEIRSTKRSFQADEIPMKMYKQRMLNLNKRLIEITIKLYHAEAHLASLLHVWDDRRALRYERRLLRDEMRDKQRTYFEQSDDRDLDEFKERFWNNVERMTTLHEARDHLQRDEDVDLEVPKAAGATLLDAVNDELDRLRDERRQLRNIMEQRRRVKLDEDDVEERCFHNMMSAYRERLQDIDAKLDDVSHEQRLSMKLR